MDGALFSLSGFVSNNATWSEDIYFLENGSGMDISELDFEFQFRKRADSTSTDLVLSTSASELTIEEDDNSAETILRIDVPYTTISGMVGDYQADLVAKDSNDKLTHWASGTVTFRQSPVAF